jgi:hypothetical protein
MGVGEKTQKRRGRVFILGCVGFCLADSFFSIQNPRNAATAPFKLNGVFKTRDGHREAHRRYYQRSSDNGREIVDILPRRKFVI